ncbi:hypothetical protein AVEN_225542-1 [Araneus ventricosus]|uniref:Uncharacterized protein n=1 Tax=Araneus ventricosus TaxID=182803 RepID=A0A4Y2L4W3_ARAVE|nr:hypothetical protein AVEN_225542-1 [Araneus ventricosus]
MNNPDTREKRTLSPSGHEEHTKKKIFTDYTQTVVEPDHRVSIKYRNMTITTASTPLHFSDWLFVQLYILAPPLGFSVCHDLCFLQSSSRHQEFDMDL